MNAKALITPTESTLAYFVSECFTTDTTIFDKTYGVGRWAIVPADDLPADFSTDTYTIVDGELVKASPELIAERQAARRATEREAIRAERERRYQSEPIASLYWTWIESGIEADRAAWIAAKEAVRAELPYPEAQEGGAE